ncbi:hypothetical protein F4778DRAFT_257176 [Xylariomycetidae sp. FL2044]|nr:hypothetical protein F4778DRAFT_257176 [Xylariomycetidae sp. FL2044]
MQLTTIFLAAAAIPAAWAGQQPRLVAHPTSLHATDSPSVAASTPALINSTNQIPQAPKPLTTAAIEKPPAFEASVMGLIVFSAAGLYLL